MPFLAEANIDSAALEALEAEFDLTMLARAFGLSETSVKQLLLSSMKTTTVTGSPTAVLTLERIRGRMRFNSEERERLTQAGNAVLDEYELYRERVRDVVWHQIGTVCRFLIDTVIVSAVYAAQKLQETSPITVTNNTGSCLTLSTDHLVVVPEYSLEAIGVPFQGGPMHYAVFMVDDDSFGVIQGGSSPLLEADSAVFVIHEADLSSEVKFESAQSQTESQCAALLVASGRPYFLGALTDGSAWFFYCAMANDTKVKVVRGPGLTWCQNSGFIVATIIEILRNPGILPSIFELPLS
ncbi:hypothetical protein K438DRAFT_1968127 [Mycena galopus ATCC 62051]|nr:hypothetical protein K438DRAFT_1968127 [Mycena galopus ATCC 62051]